jgi:hypothetical protein
MERTVQSPAFISALIKSIRVRRPDDAVTHLGYLWNLGSSARVRVRRRLLICSAEDNTSIPVMAHVSKWFNEDRQELEGAVREVLRIDGTPNWYATAAGRKYVRSWWQAETSVNPYDGKDQRALLAIIEQAVRSHSSVPALQAFSATINLHGYDRKLLVDRLRELALKRNDDSAVKLADLYLRNMQTLWWDTNFTGQCLYTLLFGPVGPQLDPELDEDRVAMLVTRASAQQTAPEVPSWCLDGIHVAGADPRFSGSIKHMAAACGAFERFGRLSPDDAWDSAGMLDSIPIEVSAGRRD